MAVYVDLCPQGQQCFDNRCSNQAQLTLLTGDSPRPYCVDDAQSRLGVHKTWREQITWSESAQAWMETHGKAVIR